MKALLLLLTFSLLLKPAPPETDRKEAQKAFSLLNNIRTNPKVYVATMPFLDGVPAMPALRWNDTLAKVAEAKALDMATRKYFAHVDPDGYGMNYYMHKAGYKLNAKWVASKELNYFESLSAGAADGEKAIQNLLFDRDTPSLGHRKHLLGLDKWNASLVDIGIGYARPDGNSPYLSYVCVIIAKHDW